MRVLLLLILFLTTSCAMQVSGNDTPTSDSPDAAPVVDTSGPGRGGQNCAKPIYLMIDGKQYYQPGMCPIPSLKDPEPDPALKTPGIEPIIQPAQPAH